MPCGPLVHRAPTVGIVLCHMGSNVHPAEFSHEFLRVVVLVSSQGHPLSPRNGLRHEHRRFPLRSSIRLGQKGLRQKSVAVLHQYMSQVAQLGLASFGLLEQTRLRIRCRFVGLVLSLFPVKVHLSARSRRLSLPVLPPKALLDRKSTRLNSSHLYI